MMSLSNGFFAQVFLALATGLSSGIACVTAIQKYDKTRLRVIIEKSYGFIGFAQFPQSGFSILPLFSNKYN